MKKEDLDVDPQSMDNRRLSVIARNPNHPMHSHAKSELDRRRMRHEGLSSFKNFDDMKEAVRRKGAPKITGDSIAIQRAKDAELNKALGRTKTGRKKPERTMTSTQKSLASMQKETKGAPKGYHFTRDGKLRKGDAGADGDGGAKLRSDPLDKQRSKIPPLPEKFANAAQQAAVMAKLKKSGKYDGKEDVKEVLDTPKAMDSYKEQVSLNRSSDKLTREATIPDGQTAMTKRPELTNNDKDKLAKIRKMLDREKKTFKALRKEQVSLNRSSINELDKKTLGSYIKKAGPDADVQRAKAQRHSDAGDMADKDKDMYKHYGKSQRAMDKYKNRVKGINKAVDKLTKEALERDGPKKPDIFGPKGSFGKAASASPAIQKYMAKKAAGNQAQNKAMDPGAAKKGYGIGVTDIDKADKKAKAKGTSMMKRMGSRGKMYKAGKMM
jgi:hypothetical protein